MSTDLDIILWFDESAGPGPTMATLCRSLAGFGPLKSADWGPLRAAALPGLDRAGHRIRGRTDPSGRRVGGHRRANGDSGPPRLALQRGERADGHRSLDGTDLAPGLSVSPRSATRRLCATVVPEPLALLQAGCRLRAPAGRGEHGTISRFCERSPRMGFRCGGSLRWQNRHRRSPGTNGARKPSGRTPGAACTKSSKPRRSRRSKPSFGAADSTR